MIDAPSHLTGLVFVVAWHLILLLVLDDSFRRAAPRIETLILFYCYSQWLKGSCLCKYVAKGHGQNWPSLIHDINGDLVQKFSIASVHCLFFMVEMINCIC